MILLLAASALFAPPALAQEEEPPPTDDEVNAVAAQLYCPVCENIPLDVCDSPACADWREEIRTMLAEGYSEDEITAAFAARYGRRVLASPDARGIDVLVWALPPVGVIAGAIVLALALRRMAPGALTPEPTTAVALSYDDLDPDIVARLERELKEFTTWHGRIIGG